jgi:hypothetical protein
MKLVLCKSPTVGSALLRWYMSSRWSHSAIYDEEAGVVYDTTFWQGGCKVHSSDAFFKKYPQSRLVSLLITNKEDARSWLTAQLGKKYDWTALLGIYFRRNWQEDDAWFCSEMSEAFIGLFDRPRFNEQAHRITPYHQDIVSLE